MREDQMSEEIAHFSGVNECVWTNHIISGKSLCNCVTDLLLFSMKISSVRRK